MWTLWCVSVCDKAWSMGTLWNGIQHGCHVPNEVCRHIWTKLYSSTGWADTDSEPSKMHRSYPPILRHVETLWPGTVLLSAKVCWQSFVFLNIITKFYQSMMKWCKTLSVTPWSWLLLMYYLLNKLLGLTIQHGIIGWLVNDEFGRMWREEVMA